MYDVMEEGSRWQCELPPAMDENGLLCRELMGGSNAHFAFIMSSCEYMRVPCDRVLLCSPHSPGSLARPRRWESKHGLLHLALIYSFN